MKKDISVLLVALPSVTIPLSIFEFVFQNEKPLKLLTNDLTDSQKIVISRNGRAVSGEVSGIDMRH